MPATAAAPPTPATEEPLLTTGIIDEHDADVLMAVRALGDMRSQGATSSSPPSCRSDAGTLLYVTDDVGVALTLAVPKGSSTQATPALSRSQTISTDSGIASESEGPQTEEVANGDFVSRVSTLPLVTSVLSAYSQTKASSRVVKVGLAVILSSARTDNLLQVRCTNGGIFCQDDQ